MTDINLGEGCNWGGNTALGAGIGGLLALGLAMVALAGVVADMVMDLVLLA